MQFARDVRRRGEHLKRSFNRRLVGVRPSSFVAGMKRFEKGQNIMLDGIFLWGPKGRERKRERDRKTVQGSGFPDVVEIAKFCSRHG